MVRGVGLQLQGLEIGIIPKQETVFLTFLSGRIPKGLMGQDVSSPSGQAGINSECRYTIAWCKDNPLVL